MVRICIFAAISALVIVSSFGCDKRGASNTPSGSPQQATTSPTESPEPPTTTEETIIAGPERTQPTETTEENTALEGETTALQGEGELTTLPGSTRTSPKARIVCLRQGKGTPPPTNSTEALNGDVLTRVLTPKVAAQPDGLHLRVVNRLSKATTYRSEPSGKYFLSLPITIPRGISNHVVEFPPGIAGFQCDPTGQFNIYQLERAPVQIVAEDSGYKPTKLECEPGATPSRGILTASGAVSKYELVSYRDTVEEAREHFSNRLKEGDVVEAAGYPEAPNQPVRVVRNAKVVATYEDLGSSGYEETWCEGQF